MFLFISIWVSSTPACRQGLKELSLWMDSRVLLLMLRDMGMPKNFSGVEADLEILTFV